ncbi:MAG: ABC transporter substrate-binding protein [Rhizobiales bacterium]|nr:ABC transporter substrate-binding protein [Hyphomicrobiales bacterium]
MTRLPDKISRRKLLAFAAFLTAQLPTSQLALADTPQEQFVKDVSRQIIALANSGGSKPALRKRFTSLISRYSNAQSVAMLALGTYRGKLPADKKDEFVRLVTQYMAAFFVYYIDEFRGTSLEIKSSAPQGKLTLVDTRITNGGPVRWRIVGGGGGYRVQDINVRAVWLSLQLKQRFTDVLKRNKGDFNALFAELKSAENW